MKKFCYVLIISFLFAFVMPAIGEEVDLNGYSTEDLAILRDKISDELINRGFEFRDEFPSGSYTVGKDIREGSYDLEIVFDENEDDPTAMLDISIYKNEEDYKKKEHGRWDFIEQGKYHIDAKDGMVFSIQFYGDAKLIITNSKPVWAP